jgi:CDP-diacylglycerol--serine O-phosphatidyltransferase
LSLLLIAEIPLFALKFKNFSWADNKLVYVFLTLALILILSIKFLAIPIIIIFYILLSIVNNMFLKQKIKD